MRQEIINSNISNQDKITDNLKILVLGGSQAAKIFAEELPPIFEKLNNDVIKLKIFQQCQKNRMSSHFKW